MEKAWNSTLNSFVDTLDEDGQVDASLLVMHQIGFLPPTHPRFLGLVQAVEKKLRSGDHIFRYGLDFMGKPETAFNVCTFWFIQALAAVGRKEEASRMFENMLKCRNHLGLLSEDIDSETNELWGNFPQTYSMVGIIRCAFALSKPWEGAF